MSRRIGVLGGSFDPIHRGHVEMAAAAETALQLTLIFITPARIPPHRAQPVASSFHRFAMVALAVATRPRWRACDLELLSEGPSYTSNTLRAFHRHGYEPSELFFLVGADAFLEIAAWKDYPVILDLSHFAVFSRPDCPVTELPKRLPSLASRMATPPLASAADGPPRIILIDAETADVSSTGIRQRRAEGRSIAGMVDAAVQGHIEQHDLYLSESQDPHLISLDPPPSAAMSRWHAGSRPSES